MIETIFPDLLLILVAALAGGLVAHRLRLPLILGYVMAGITIGPYTVGPTITQLPLVETLARSGLALMLFTQGLQFSFKDLARVRSFAWLGTSLQMVATVVCGIGVALLLGWSWPATLWFGVIFSLSSITITRRALVQIKRADPQTAHLSSAILIVQNLSIFVFILVLDNVGPKGESVSGIIAAFVGGWLVLTVLLFFGTQVVYRIATYFVTALPEVKGLVMLACVVLLTVGLYWVGLPILFVAIALGITFGKSKLFSPLFRPLISWQPFFDVLFFVSVGVLLDLPLIFVNLGAILPVVVLAMIGKCLLLILLVRLFGYPGRTPILVGIALSQLGELSLIISQMGADAGVLDATQYTISVAIVVLSLLASSIVWLVIKKYLGEKNEPAGGIRMASNGQYPNGHHARSGGQISKPQRYQHSYRALIGLFIAQVILLMLIFPALIVYFENRQIELEIDDGRGAGELREDYNYIDGLYWSLLTPPNLDLESGWPQTPPGKILVRVSDVTKVLTVGVLAKLIYGRGRRFALCRDCDACNPGCS